MFVSAKVLLASVYRSLTLSLIILYNPLEIPENGLKFVDQLPLKSKLQ